MILQIGQGETNPPQNLESVGEAVMLQVGGSLYFDMKTARLSGSMVTVRCFCDDDQALKNRAQPLTGFGPVLDCVVEDLGDLSAVGFS